MKTILLKSFLILTLLTLQAGCGAGTSETGETGGSHLGPIVNADGDYTGPGGVEISLICSPNEYPQDLTLEIAEVRNHFGLEGDSKDPANPLRIHDGEIHSYAQAEEGDGEPQTEIELSLTKGEENPVVDGMIFISFYYLEHVIEANLTGIPVSDFPIITTFNNLNGIKLSEGNTLPATFKDNGRANGKKGYFDWVPETAVPLPPEFYWHSNIIVGQVCNGTILEDGAPKSVSSDPVYFSVVEGFEEVE